MRVHQGSGNMTDATKPPYTPHLCMNRFMLILLETHSRRAPWLCESNQVGGLVNKADFGSKVDTVWLSLSLWCILQPFWKGL